MSRLLVSALAALAFASLGIAGEARASHDLLLATTTQCKVTSGTQMLCLVNHARGASGLQPLFRHPELVLNASAKADRINACRQFTHFPCGDRHTCPTVLPFCGENIAYGMSIRVAFDALMHSPGHRANMLSSRFRYWGSAYRAAGVFYRLWVHQFA